MHSNRRPLWRRVAPVGILTALALTACADNAPQDTFKPESPLARKIHDLISPIMIVAGVIFVIVYALIAVCVIKFRRKGDDDVPKQVHGSTPAEIGWTIAPAVLMATIGVFSTSMIFTVAEEPKDPYEITVIGHQWWWEYRYPAPGETRLNTILRNETVVDEATGASRVVANVVHERGKDGAVDGEAAPVIVTANELHIPADRPVRLRVTSADVIHSYWPPRLNGKIDAVPGRINSLTLEAESKQFEPGKTSKTYLGQCAEFCATSHANMRLTVVAQTQEEFDKWLANQAKPPVNPATGSEAEAGKALFEGSAGCAACHWMDPGKRNDAAKIGPNLAHFGTRATFAGATMKTDTRSLTAWLRNPAAVKPGSKMVIRKLSEDEIAKLVAYLESLK